MNVGHTMALTPQQKNSLSQQQIQQIEDLKNRARAAQAQYNEDVKKDISMRNNENRRRRKESVRSEAYFNDRKALDQLMEKSQYHGYENAFAQLMGILDFWDKYCKVLMHFLADLPGVRDLKEWIDHYTVEQSDEPDLTMILPVITHQVDMDINGNLKQEPLRFLQTTLGNTEQDSKNHPLFNDFQKDLNNMVEIWLYCHTPHYTIDKANPSAWKVMQGGQAITPDEFKKLRDDPKTGLDAFIGQALDEMSSEYRADSDAKPNPSFGLKP